MSCFVFLLLFSLSFCRSLSHFSPERMKNQSCALLYCAWIIKSRSLFQHSESPSSTRHCVSLPVSTADGVNSLCCIATGDPLCVTLEGAITADGGSVKEAAEGWELPPPNESAKEPPRAASASAALSMDPMASYMGLLKSRLADSEEETSFKLISVC